MLSPRLSSSTRSTSRNGYRCGSCFRIPRMSISFDSVIASTFSGRTPRASGSLLELGDTFVKRGESFETRDELAPAARLLEGDAGRVYPGARDRMADHRSARDDDPVTDREPAADRDGPANHAVRADDGASGNARAAGDRRMRADAH